jgi:hypothetical protein
VSLSPGEDGSAMDPSVLLALLHLIVVHGPDNQTIELNVNEISSIREIRDVEEAHYAKDANCIVFMTNGKFIGTREECVEVVRKVKEAE